MHLRRGLTVLNPTICPIALGDGSFEWWIFWRLPYSILTHSYIDVQAFDSAGIDCSVTLWRKDGDEQEISHLIARLQNHEHWHIRAEAAQRLGLHRQDRIYYILVAALDDPHPEVRSAAIGGLGTLGDKRAVDRLLTLLEYAYEYPSEYWAYDSAWSHR